jgi:nucleoside-diphosphate-sugar epimerase
MKRALITGATSFLGITLTKKLLANGVDVHVVARPSSDLSRFDNNTFLPHIHTHDGSSEAMNDIVASAKPDIVFHLASQYLREVEPHQVVPLLQSNIIFGTQLLEAMRIAETGYLINAGTYTQYYNSDTFRPLNLYAATKQAFDTLVSYYSDEFGLKTTTLILFDSYGPGDWRKKIMFAIRNAILSNQPLPLPTENLTLDLLHIDDVAAAFIQAAELIQLSPERIQGGHYRVGHGDRYSLESIITLFEEESGQSIIRNWGAYPLPERRIVTPWNGPGLPEWHPKRSLRQGIRQFLDEIENI